jgi:hypothetical protein
MWLLLRAFGTLSLWLVRAALLVAAAVVLVGVVEHLWPGLLLRTFESMVRELGE